MFTVAFIGPDGAGKSTIIEGIRQNSPYPMRHIYMGVNPDSLTHVFPTTRLVNYLKKPKNSSPEISIAEETVKTRKMNKRQKGVNRLSLWRHVKSFLFIANRISEEWYRQVFCWYYLWRGYIVLFDRHFYLDALTFELAHPDVKQPFLRRIHNILLEQCYPRPDLTICLDAPAEILFARKGESTVEKLNQMREAYLKIKDYVPVFHVVDTVQPPETILEIVLNYIKSYQENLKEVYHS